MPIIAGGKDKRPAHRPGLAEAWKQKAKHYRWLVQQWERSYERLDETLARVTMERDELEAEAVVERIPVRRLPTPVLNGIEQGRVETGVTVFGDDWPGLFIRGDDCFHLAGQIQIVLDAIQVATDEGEVELDFPTVMAIGSLASLMASLRQTDMRVLRETGSV